MSKYLLKNLQQQVAIPVRRLHPEVAKGCPRTSGQYHQVRHLVEEPNSSCVREFAKIVKPTHSALIKQQTAQYLEKGIDLVESWNVIGDEATHWRFYLRLLSLVALNILKQFAHIWRHFQLREVLWIVGTLHVSIALFLVSVLLLRQ